LPDGPDGQPRYEIRGRLVFDCTYYYVWIGAQAPNGPPPQLPPPQPQPQPPEKTDEEKDLEARQCHYNNDIDFAKEVRDIDNHLATRQMWCVVGGIVTESISKIFSFFSRGGAVLCEAKQTTLRNNLIYKAP